MNPVQSVKKIRKKQKNGKLTGRKVRLEIEVLPKENVQNTEVRSERK